MTDAAASHRSSRFAADLEFARDVAEAAGRIQADKYERIEQIDYKSAKDVVTEVDHLCEDLVIGAIRRTFPGDRILAEESGAHTGEVAGEDAVSPAEAATRLATGRAWIIDPLDGTVNYANGLPFFCVSVGLIVDGKPAAGAVHDPMRGETYSAVADGPAWLTSRDRGTVEIHASDRDIKDWIVHLALGGRAVATRAAAVRKAVRITRNMGSSALGLAYVANGRFDGLVQSGGMSAWDIAAAGLIAERAGALVTDPAGGPWFDITKANRAFGVVAAPPAQHGTLLRLSGEPPKA